jgi:hypothetical protein
MFFLEHFDMLSGGALGSLTVGLVTCWTWERGLPRALSAGPNSTFAPGVERVMAKVGGLGGAAGGGRGPGQGAFGPQALPRALGLLGREGHRGCGQALARAGSSGVA